jgi:hypothetical protein
MQNVYLVPQNLLTGPFRDAVSMVLGHPIIQNQECNVLAQIITTGPIRHMSVLISLIGRLLDCHWVIVYTNAMAARECPGLRFTAGKGALMVEDLAKWTDVIILNGIDHIVETAGVFRKTQQTHSLLARCLGHCTLPDKDNDINDILFVIARVHVLCD